MRHDICSLICFCGSLTSSDTQHIAAHVQFSFNLVFHVWISQTSAHLKAVEKEAPQLAALFPHLEVPFKSNQSADFQNKARSQTFDGPEVQ